MMLPSSQPIAIPAGAANRSRGPVESAPQPEPNPRQTHLPAPDPWFLGERGQVPVSPPASYCKHKPSEPGRAGVTLWQHGRGPQLYEAWLKGP
jgi:hypothetical protein